MAVRWPARITPDDASRAQFHHVNDVVPTIYEIIGITSPRTVQRHRTGPHRRREFCLHSPATRRQKGQLLTQYFEIMGSRAIYHDGWMACAFGLRAAVAAGDSRPAFTNGRQTRTFGNYTISRMIGPQANDLAAQMPEKLAQMKDIFLIEAANNKALPIGGGLWVVVLHPEQAHQPALHRVDLFRRYHPHAGILRAGARQQTQTTTPSTP